MEGERKGGGGVNWFYHNFGDMFSNAYGVNKNMSIDINP